MAGALSQLEDGFNCVRYEACRVSFSDGNSILGQCSLEFVKLSELARLPSIRNGWPLQSQARRRGGRMLIPPFQ